MRDSRITFTLIMRSPEQYPKDIATHGVVASFEKQSKVGAERELAPFFCLTPHPTQVTSPVASAPRPL